LVIALGVADSITAAPRAVPGYRRLVAHRPNQHLPDPERDGIAAAYLKPVFNPERPFGAALDRFVGLLTNPAAARDVEAAAMHVELFADPRLPRAVIRYRTFDPPEDDDAPLTELIYRPRNTPPGVSRELDPAWNFLPPALITRTAVIPASLFSILANLWMDTRQHIAGRATEPPIPAASPTADPEAESAASLPQPAAPRLNQPSANREQPSPQTARRLSQRDTVDNESMVAVITEESPPWRPPKTKPASR
jgi:hypothetical protein